MWSDDEDKLVKEIYREIDKLQLIRTYYSKHAFGKESTLALTKQISEYYKSIERIRNENE